MEVLTNLEFRGIKIICPNKRIVKWYKHPILNQCQINENFEKLNKKYLLRQMKNKELEKIDNLIGTLPLIQNILSDLRGIYIYYNEPTKDSREIVFHKHTCGHCAFGSGKRKKKTPGKNGVWIGPFSTSRQAEKFLQLSGLNVAQKKKCTCI